MGRDLYFHICLLVRAVCIEERSGEIYDLFSSPDQDKPRLFRDNGNFCRLQVFLCGVRHELIHIFRIYNNRHTLLGFRDGNLCSVKAGIFFRDFIKFNAKSVRKLADGHRHAARAEVVTLLDEAAYFLAAEQTLDLTLCRRISLLYFRTARLDRFNRMDFGRTGCAAAAVASRAAAEQDDDIARIRILTDHGTSRSRAQHSADLHTFRHIVGMIDLFYKACCKTDLVAVGTVSVSRLAHQLLLGQLAL